MGLPVEPSVSSTGDNSESLAIGTSSLSSVSPRTEGSAVFSIGSATASSANTSAYGAVFPSTPLVATGTTAVFPSVGDQLYISSFALVNLLLARLMFTGGFFRAIPEQLLVFWGTVNALLGVLVLGFCLPGLFAQAVADLKRVYFSLAVLKAIALSALGLILASGLILEQSYLQSASFYDSVVFVAWVMCAEEWLRARFSKWLGANVGFSLAGVAPRVRRFEPYPNHEPVESECAASELRTGELFRIAKGSIVPCDGLVVEGSAELQELRTSGAEASKYKTKGHKVFAGSRLVGGELLCEAVCKADESMITSFADDLAKRLNAEQQHQLVSEIWETRFSIVLLFAAMGLGAYQYGIGSGISGALNVAAAILAIGFVVRCSFLVSSAGTLALSHAFYAGMRLRSARVLRTLSKAKNLIVDFVAPFPHEYYFVKSFEVVDQRVDREGLVHVLLNILGSSDEQRNEAITSFLRKSVSGTVTHRISDPRAYEGRGISAIVGGVEFSVGTEDFLVDRGVYLQASELVPAQPSQVCLYVAMRDELVAHLTLERRPVADANAFQQDLRAFGLRLMLCSSETPEKADRVGRELGLDLAYIHGDMSPERYIEKIRGQGTSAFLLDAKTDPVLAREAASTISFFDEFRWDLDRADVVLMREDLLGLARVFKLVRRYSTAQAFLISLPIVAASISGLSAVFMAPSAGIFILAWTLPLCLAYALLPRLLPPKQ
jgi:cation transport ATPase